jgi:hypothetical protein
MPLKQSIVLYLLTLAVFFLVDMIWLGWWPRTSTGASSAKC